MNFFLEIIGIFVFLIVVFFFIGFNILVGDLSCLVGLGFLGVLFVSFVVLVIGFSLGGIIGYVINLACDLGLCIVYVFLFI